MKRDLDRRAVFFFCSALVCLALVPVALPKFRWVGETLVVSQVILGLLSLFDYLSRRKRTDV